MKTILHIFSSFEVGGVQRRFAELIRLQHINGYDSDFHHQIFAMDGNYDALSLLNKTAPVTKVDINLPTGSFWSKIKATRDIIRHANAGLIMTYNWGSSFFDLANRYSPVLPIIHVQDGFGRDEQNKQITRRRWLRRIAYGGAGHVIVPSLLLKNMAEKTWNIASDKLHYIPNGIDLDSHSQSADSDLKKSLGLDDAIPIIGTVCGLRPEKNIGRMIEAFSKIDQKHPDARLLIVGDGPAMPPLKLLAERTGLGEKIIFAGYQSEPQKYIALMDILAISSDTEQMPIAVIEAMAASKVIASTDVGDVRNMVSENNQQYVNGKSAELLAQSLNELINRFDEFGTLGAANKAKAFDEFKDQTMYEKWYDLYSRLAK